MARYTIPRDLYFGQGTIAELKRLKVNKAIIVSGEGSIKGSTID